MINTLIEAAKMGGSVALTALPTATMDVLKEKGDFATSADLKSQEVIKNILTRDFPQIQIIAEEDDETETNSANFFTVDPFDGTVIGNNGSPEWGVLLSYVENYKPKLAVLYQPVLKRMLVAEVSTGCNLSIDDKIKKIAVFSDRSKKDRYLFAMDIFYHTKVSSIKNILLPLVEKNKIINSRHAGCSLNAGIELVTGAIDIFISEFGKVWDYAPIACATLAAGGAAYTLDSETLEYRDFKCDRKFDGILIARSKEIAEDVFDVIGAVGAPFMGARN